MCAPQSEPSCLVPTDTVVDSDRVLRRPITEWASEIAARLNSCSHEAPDFKTIRHVCGALNNAALVFVYSGQPGLAEDTCKSQLDWLGTFRGLFPAAELAALAVHPWVNLGRLCRRSEDVRRALQHFCAIDLSNRTRTVRFERWECAPTDALRQSAEPLCVYEILRTYLQTGDVDEAIAFAAASGDSLTLGASMLKTELLLHVYLRRAEPHSLLPLMKAMTWPQDRFGVFAKHYYSAVLLTTLQQSNLSGNALERLAPHWIAYLNCSELDSRDLRLAIELCRLAKHVNCSGLFAALFSAAAAAVLGVREVPFASQLIQLGNSFARPETLSKLQTFVQRYGYKTPSPSALSLAELRAAISQTFDVGKRALCA